jgi:hypothetical protein
MFLECLTGLFAAQLCLETLVGTMSVPPAIRPEPVSVLLGDVSSTTARLRVQVPEGTRHVMLEYWPKKALAAAHRKTSQVQLSPAEHSVARVVITDLRQAIPEQIARTGISPRC